VTNEVGAVVGVTKKSVEASSSTTGE